MGNDRKTALAEQYARSALLQASADNLAVDPKTGKPSLWDRPLRPPKPYVVLRQPWWTEKMNRWRDLADVLLALSREDLLAEVEVEV